MVINKDLKNVSFTYDESSKLFCIKKSDEEINLNKVESFAFLRFLIRISQRNWLRKKPIENQPSSEESWDLNPEQLEMLIVENE